MKIWVNKGEGKMEMSHQYDSAEATLPDYLA